MNKTTTPSLETIERNWFLVDAKDKTLGRLATQIATVLRGKNKPTFTPHLDTGDKVRVPAYEKAVVLNLCLKIVILAKPIKLSKSLTEMCISSSRYML